MRPVPTLALLLLAAACARPARPEARRDPATRFDSATAARLCADPRQARTGPGGCELRDQAPAPEMRPLRRP